MGKQISKETESAITKLGIYQIIGGSLGILIILWSMYKSPFFTGLTILIYLLILLFFAYSIFCGTLCLKTKSNALKHSLINQLLQLIGFAMLGFAFKYVAGIYFTVGLDLTEAFKLDFGVGISKFDFNINKENERFEIDLNLVALVLVLWIDKLIKKRKNDIEIRKLSSIGQI